MEEPDPVAKKAPVEELVFAYMTNPKHTVLHAKEEVYAVTTKSDTGVYCAKEGNAHAKNQLDVFMERKLNGYVLNATAKGYALIINHV